MPHSQRTARRNPKPLPTIPPAGVALRGARQPQNPPLPQSATATGEHDPECAADPSIFDKPVGALAIILYLIPVLLVSWLLLLAGNEPNPLAEQMDSKISPISNPSKDLLERNGEIESRGTGIENPAPPVSNEPGQPGVNRLGVDEFAKRDDSQHAHSSNSRTVARPVAQSPAPLNRVAGETDENFLAAGPGDDQQRPVSKTAPVAVEAGRRVLPPIQLLRLFANNSGESGIRDADLQRETVSDEPTMEAPFYGTKIEWHRLVDEAATKASTEDKLVFLMHVSGNFTQEEFT